MKRVLGMSAKVLQRKREQREQRWAAVRAIFACGLLAMMVGYMGYSIHLERVKLMPTWAQFSTKDSYQELRPAKWDMNVRPARVLVNGEEWSIVEVTSFNDFKNRDGTPKTAGHDETLAQTYCENRTIAFIPDMSPSSLRDNLWHEIFHAGACAHGGDAWWNSEKPTGVDHPGVYHLGDFMAEFALANPQFMTWAAGGK